VTTTPALAAAAVLLAFALDRLAGEFPERVHPVALFGRCVAPLDRAWSRPRLAGLAVAVCLPLAAAAAVGVVVALAARVPLPPRVPSTLAAALPAAVAGVALFATTSLRMLVRTAGEVIELAGTDLDAARARLRALAGRDASGLSPGQVRSAAVESAAENLADGLVAPLSAFALGAAVSLPVAAAAAAWVKAVNTLDSMLGYPSKPHGAASARLDDAVAFLPARASALLLALAAPAVGAPWRARAAASRPASPNSGWPMGTLAVALGVRLAKPGAYTLNADARLPSPDAAARGVRVVARAGLLAWALAAAGLAVGVGAGGVVGWS
jgi:adenosylcobinamide-phosphate synthase